MDFFGDYSIETASCHPSSIRRPQHDTFITSDISTPREPVSPRDTRTSYPIDLANVSNLARAFSLQNLDSTSAANTYDSDFGSNYALATTDSYNEPLSPSASAFSSAMSMRSPPCWKRRLQRQRDMRLHCDASHLRSISELVERMVEERDQCEAIPRRRPSIALIPHFTASFDVDDDSVNSDPSTPRSLSGSSNGCRPSYFAEPGSPGLRRSTEISGMCSSKDGRVQKVRHQRSYTREKR